MIVNRVLNGFGHSEIATYKYTIYSKSSKAYEFESAVDAIFNAHVELLVREVEDFFIFDKSRHVEIFAD